MAYIDTVQEALPQFDHLGIEVHGVNPRARQEAWGKVVTHRFCVSDGAKYNLRVYNPDRPAEVLPITYTTPWLTDLRGFNDHIATMLAQKGARAIVVGPEQRTFGDAIRLIGRASLAHDAFAHHLMLTSVAKRTDLDTSHVATMGYSRGAMEGFALQAYASAHRRQQPYNDYIDPCLARRVGIKEVPWLNLPRYAAKELSEITTAILPHPQRTLRDLAPTLVTSPGFLVSQFSTGRALFAGEAGTFAAHLPPDSRTHITLFLGSIFNHASDWEERLAPYPNVTIREEEGAHLTGANIEVIERAIGRVMTAAAA